LRRAASEPVSKRKLTSAVMESFIVSDQPARKFIDYYVEGEYLKILEGKPYDKYQINEGQLPF